jgi:polysaccharide biosynthesis/export protein
MGLTGPTVTVDPEIWIDEEWRGLCYTFLEEMETQLPSWVHLFRCSFLLLLLLTWSAAATAQNSSPAIARPANRPPANAGSSGTASSDSDPVLLLGSGDLLEVSVYNVPELTTKARVGNNGNVYLPLVDYIHVAGLTLEEAQSLVAKRLSDGGFVKDPHVTIFVDEYTSQGISVMGEVARPGVFPILGQRRLFDVISAAGGLTDRAGRSATLIHRDQPDKPITLALARNLNDSTQSNVEVLPGDTLIVRKADVVYVVGDVGKPSGFTTDAGKITVLQAIALAGGTTKTSKLNGARIVRKGPNGNMTETPVQLRKILEAKIPDMPMQADDILFVPSSAGKIAAMRTIDAVVSTATALTIVAIHP